MSDQEAQDYQEMIAIIGMGGRFPQARDVNEFWQRLRDGEECFTTFSVEDLEAAGVDRSILDDPAYVNTRGVIEDIDLFDAAFFGYTPREAEIMDPQQRLFLECAWESLERAGYAPATYPGLIGVYAGLSINSYLVSNLQPNRDLMRLVGGFQVMIGNDKDHMPTHVSYKLNLRGPSINVQSACSTSLVAVSLACQGLLNYQCDMALAGGVSVLVPQKVGYYYQENGILSPDGHCRAFDAEARGTVGGSGLGIVVLKRLQDALKDGDHIHAVIRGSAINNDGNAKVGYTAPGVTGQAEVIALAHALADVDVETISYIETHGTGTRLGDPIEMAALTQAFRASTDAKGFCAVGSVKTNIGHLDTAAGVAGLIKTVLAMEHRLLPPSLHFENPNPEIDFASSPFYVNTTLAEWPAGRTPRRAGVSSFGIGGTNAHVVVEEAPVVEPSGPARPQHLLVLSARTGTALEAATTRLAGHLKQHPDTNLADVAYTLQVGRTPFPHRRMLVCDTLDSAVAALSGGDPRQLLTSAEEPRTRSVAFMFPGQGSQYANMGATLYATEQTFREQVDLCAGLLAPHIGLDIRTLLYPKEEEIAEAEQQLGQTKFTQPALFVIEYALAKLWMEWGIRPAAMIGHSIGEYVAACLAGVFSLPDALRLVALRGKMVQVLPPGAMLSVPLPESEVRPLLSRDLSLAAINAPALCTVSGATEAVALLAEELSARGVTSRRLHTSHAFHSAMMEPMLADFSAEVAKTNRKPPTLPYLSNVTGTWITAQLATDPAYWTRHLRQTVRFAQGITDLAQTPDQILLEVGPGHTLSTLARQQVDQDGNPLVFSSLPPAGDRQSDITSMLRTVGQLWLSGQQVDWQGFSKHQRRQRVILPTYPFERQRYWVDPPQEAGNAKKPAAVHKSRRLEEWFYSPSWKRSTRPRPHLSSNPGSRWLVFADQCGVGDRIAGRLCSGGEHVFTVTPGEQFARTGEKTYTLNPHRRDDYAMLLADLYTRGGIPDHIVHCWSVTEDDAPPGGRVDFAAAQHLGFYSLLFLTQALSERGVSDPLNITVMSNGIWDVTGQEALCPEKATVLGACKVIAQEYTYISCRAIDIATNETTLNDDLRDSLIAEITADVGEVVIAYRGGYRWVQAVEPLALPPVEESPWRHRGVYLITGGLGGIGLILAEHLARQASARLVLLGRSKLPERDEWEELLRTQDSHDDRVRVIGAIQALEELGAQVMPVSADVADEAEMSGVLDRIYSEFGELHGVIHAAGGSANDSFRTISASDRESCERQFRPKVHGLLVLDNLLRGRKLDFCLLFSSLSSVLGGIGFATYSAANIFMDAFVDQRRRAENGTTWISVNWEGWRMSEAQPSKSGSQESTLVKLALAPSEGAEALTRIVATNEPGRVIVSTGDLETRIDQWTKLESLRRPELVEADVALSAHSRPKLQTPYVAPRNEVEEQIAGIWQVLLGVGEVGIYDNFYELGGHSLLAIQLLSRIRDAYKVEVPIQHFFGAPTVADLTEYVESARQKAEDRKRRSPSCSMGRLILIWGKWTMHKLSKRIDRLSPEQRKLLERLLAAQGVSASPALADIPEASPDTGSGTVNQLQKSFDSTDVEGQTFEEQPADPSSQSKARTHRFYNAVSQQLDMSPFAEHALFLNYGYMSNGQPQQALFQVPEHQINRNSIQLVLELVGDCPLDGRAVLDVGCGRGGTLSVIHEYFAAERLVGLDLSSTAIAFCKRRHNYPNTHFFQGDAEHLPFHDGSFDVVTNVESSHTYPDVYAFFREVYRVLHMGGYFLYTDLLHGDIMESYLAFLNTLGFICERNQDITRNVLLSCNATASRHAQAFSQENDGEVMKEFLSTSDSQIYEEMADGRASYRIFRLRKA